MKQELAEVRQTVEHLTRDQLAIAYKWNDGAGTYTPPVIGTTSPRNTFATRG